MEENIVMKKIRELMKQGTGGILKFLAILGYAVCIIYGLNDDSYHGTLIVSLVLMATSIIDASEKMQLLRKEVYLSCFVLLVAAFFLGFSIEDSKVLAVILKVSSIATVILGFVDLLDVWPSSANLVENSMSCNSCVLYKILMDKVEGVEKSKMNSSSDEQTASMQIPIEYFQFFFDGRCESCTYKKDLMKKASSTKLIFKKNKNTSFDITVGNTVLIKSEEKEESKEKTNEQKTDY